MASLTGYFSQQLVQFEACLQRDDATAVTVAKTNNYTAHGVFLDNYTADEFGPMVAAINVGLIQPVEDLANVLTNGCISGNCTFPSTDRASISTIGIGHVCEDMSDYIRQNNGSTMFVGKSNSSSLTIRDMDKTVLVTLVTGATDNPSFGMANISMLFRQHWKLTKFAAIRCSLYPTVFTYGINMTNSVLDEQVVESVPIQRHGMRLSPGSTQDHRDNHTFTHKMATTHTFRNGSREVCIGSRDPRPELVKVFLQRSDTSLGQPLNESIPDVALYYPRDCVWSFGMGASSGILRSLQTIFHNQELVWGGRGNTSGSVHLRALFQPGRMSREDLNAHLQGNISLDTVDDIMKTMTRAMTAVVRTNGYERFQGQDWNAYGDMWYNTTCVRIRWEWIIFPIIMIALTGVFLLLVVFENRDVKSDRLWKSSVLAGMFCEIHIQQGIPVGKEGMVEVAHSTSVSFEEKSETLRLLER
ncbi:hypothetical protein ST47_g4838 [Ascochyta rabiei]|uniref:Uncharacterized protein n=2 Tax=Didymella rabiei TaxID=5454 RepID=A0A163ETJ3_DIDRA|nr:hypothetical protein ST47_g4838 [Ascochyta rabiei]